MRMGWSGPTELIRPELVSIRVTWRSRLHVQGWLGLTWLSRAEFLSIRMTWRFPLHVQGWLGPTGLIWVDGIHEGKMEVPPCRVG